MKITDIHKKKRPMLSFEVFPPKKDYSFEAISAVLSELIPLSPDFISVTCGAGGTGKQAKTTDIAYLIQQKYGITSLAHLTCVGSKKDEIYEQLGRLRLLGVENILALRGDIPSGDAGLSGDYLYVKQLIADLRGEGFCIGAAAYPEGHIDCESDELNIRHLYEKQQAGADFFITQLFFDNAVFYRFYEMALAKGINLPIMAGIMPMYSRSQVEKMIFMCAASLPSAMIKLLNKYKDSPKDMMKAGVEYASEQISDLLAGGVDGIHFYAMNKPDIARMMAENIYANR